MARPKKVVEQPQTEETKTEQPQVEETVVKPTPEPSVRHSGVVPVNGTLIIRNKQTGAKNALRAENAQRLVSRQPDTYEIVK